MPLSDGLKRIVLGQALRSERLPSLRVSKRSAMPIFASDALSSNAYATQEILLVLSLGGVAFLAYGPWVALAVGVVFVVVIASYRQTVMEYPDGGGDYEVVRENLGSRWGVVVASALMIDYALTVAVAVSAAIANLGSILPFFSDYRGWWAAIAIAGIALVNLRGIRQSGRILVLPTYFFIVAIAVLVVTGGIRTLLGQEMKAESADWIIEGQDTFTGLALAFLLARAFASGTTALTGIQVVANSVPAFHEPKAKNAAATLTFIAIISMSMFAGITWLASATGVRVANADSSLIGLPEGETQKTIIVQIAQAVFGQWQVLVLVLAIATVLILLLAANTAFNGFPLLGSRLGRDGYLPRQMHTRGDRLVYSNGILLLAAFSILLVIAFNASVTALIQLYIVGVFIAFSLGQLGMVRHWTRRLGQDRNQDSRRSLLISRGINFIGFILTTLVLLIVLVSKFTTGGWIVVLAVPILSALMLGIHRHYDRVGRELAAAEAEHSALPTRVHALVLVSKIHKPTLQALSYARATRPTVLEALTVQIDERETQRLAREWESRHIPVTLKVLDSPYREIARPVLDYVEELRTDNPNDLIIVYVPEYIVGRWWHRILHNQSAANLKDCLLATPGVMVTSVPWQLSSRK